MSHRTEQTDANISDFIGGLPRRTLATTLRNSSWTFRFFKMRPLHCLKTSDHIRQERRPPYLLNTPRGFMATSCINNIQHFNYQLTHTTLKKVELLKHSKISKTAPTCFGLQGNHLQGAKVSTQLQITHLVKSRYVRTGRCQCYGCILWPVRRVYRALCEGILYTLTQCTIHTPYRYVSTFNQVCNF